MDYSDLRSRKNRPVGFLEPPQAVPNLNRATAFSVHQHRIKEVAYSAPRMRITSSSRAAAYLVVSKIHRTVVGTFSPLSQASNKVEVYSEGAAYNKHNPDRQVDCSRQWAKFSLRAKIKTKLLNQVIRLVDQIRLEQRHYCQFLQQSRLNPACFLDCG